MLVVFSRRNLDPTLVLPFTQSLHGYLGLINKYVQKCTGGLPASYANLQRCFLEVEQQPVYSLSGSSPSVGHLAQLYSHTPSSTHIMDWAESLDIMLNTLLIIKQTKIIASHFAILHNQYVELNS